MAGQPPTFDDLSEYTEAGGQDTLVYWLESKSEMLGSIWGGSAFKFGIFSRGNTESKPSAGHLSYDDHYGWYTKYGASALEAFTTVKDLIERTAQASMQSDLAAIEAIAFSPAVKWKITERFRQLQAIGRIQFVTFHQSFSYEDFVEGIRATRDEMGQLAYTVQDGVFKKLFIAAAAKVTQTTETALNVSGRTIWKMSLGNTQGEDAYIFNECVATVRVDPNVTGALRWRR